MKGKENRRYTEKDYKNVLLLRNKGFSFNEIAKKVNISRTTVSLWIKTNRKPRLLYGKRKEKKLPFYSQKLSSTLAYIYGVLVGDGSISKEKGTYRITLNVIDKEFAFKFANSLERWCGMRPSFTERIKINNTVTKYGSLIKGISHLYVVRLNSKQIGNFLLSRIKCGTFDWEVPKEIINSDNEKIICSFLQGFFDSEGYVIYSKPRSRRLEAEVSNFKGLEGIQILLRKIGVESKILQGKNQKIKNSYILRILRRKDLELFAKLINFSINRKKAKLEKILNSYKRDVYLKAEVENMVKLSLENSPKTAKEISEDINRALRTTYYHLQRLNEENKIDVIRRWKRNEYKSNVWFIKK